MRSRLIFRATLGAFLGAVAAGAVACNSSTQPPTAPGSPGPSSNPPPTATQNRDPSVTVTFTGASSCTPHGSVTCALNVSATASDPDGDQLTYTWSGCATGTAATAVCTIKDPGVVSATVAVDDGHGHIVSASAAGRGDREANRQPAVTVLFPSGATCTPSPGVPCAIDVVAQASDPDGDALQFSWSGCASGAGDRARCMIATPGPVTATVTVDDRQTPSVRASATATGAGVNRLPDITVGYVVIPAAGQGEIDILGTVQDPDDGHLCGAQYCGGAETSGACGTAFLACSCLAELEVRIARTATAGTCSVTLEVKDKWGAVGRPTITFDVATLKVLSHTALSSVASQLPVTDKR